MVKKNDSSQPATLVGVIRLMFKVEYSRFTLFEMNFYFWFDWAVIITQPLAKAHGRQKGELRTALISPLGLNTDMFLLLKNF